MLGHACAYSTQGKNHMHLKPPKRRAPKDRQPQLCCVAWIAKVEQSPNHTKRPTNTPTWWCSYSYVGIRLCRRSGATLPVEPTTKQKSQPHSQRSCHPSKLTCSTTQLRQQLCTCAPAATSDHTHTDTQTHTVEAVTTAAHTICQGYACGWLQGAHRKVFIVCSLLSTHQHVLCADASAQ